MQQKLGRLTPEAELARRCLQLSEERNVPEELGHATYEWKALHLASWNGNTRLVKQLLQQGEKIDDRYV